MGEGGGARETVTESSPINRGILATPTSDVGEEFSGGGSPEVHGASPHTRDQVAMASGPQLGQILIPGRGLGMKHYT